MYELNGKLENYIVWYIGKRKKVNISNIKMKSSAKKRRHTSLALGSDLQFQRHSFSPHDRIFLFSKEDHVFFSVRARPIDHADRFSRFDFCPFRRYCVTRIFTARGEERIS